MPSFVRGTTHRRAAIMQVKIRIKSGGLKLNHNETLVRVQKPKQSLKVKSHIKAGASATTTRIINITWGNGGLSG